MAQIRMNSAILTVSMQHNEQWNFLGIIFVLVCVTGEPQSKKFVKFKWF